MVDDHCPTHLGRDLFEQFQPFAADRGFKIVKPSDIRARARQVWDEAAADRIGHLDEDDRDRLRRLPQRPYRRIAVCQNHIRCGRDQLRGRNAVLFSASVYVTGFKPNAAALSPARSLQTLLESREVGLQIGIIFVEGKQQADPPH